VLAYAVIMLNTDAHNHLAEHTMSRAGFIAMNVEGCPDEDLDSEFLGGIFDRIQASLPSNPNPNQ
jgi:Sec7-like guanine-nucleotide exchange factor